MAISGILNIPSQTLVNQTNKNKGIGEKREVDLRDLYEFPKGVTVNDAASYNPNIGRLSTGLMFDIQYQNATTLSDGSKLVRPVCLSMGDVSIRKTGEDGKYRVTYHSYVDNETNGPITKVMSEEELLANKTLSAGKIKETDEPNKFELTYQDKQGNISQFIANKKGCLDLLENNFLYM